MGFGLETYYKIFDEEQEVPAKGEKMLHPSYADLMKVVNSDVEEGEELVVSSRYSIVMATSKRARQIISGDEVLVDNYEGRKPLSAAIEELNQAKIRILNENEELDEDSGEAAEDDTVTEDIAEAEGSVEETVINGEE